MVPARTDRLAVGADRVLDGAVLLLATWTVVYHLSLLLDVGSDVALVVELGVLSAISVARRSVVEVRGAPATSLETTAEPNVVSRLAISHVNHRRVAIGAALVAAVAMALDLPWGFVWVSWLVAGVAGA